MSFYDNERIRSKQIKFIKSSAYDIIDSLENKGFDDNEIIACIQILISVKDNSETKAEILELALKVVQDRTENINDKDDNILPSTNWM